MNRSTFIAASTSLVAATSGIAGAQSVPGGTQLVERAANFDAAAFARAVDRGSRIRQVWETVAFKPTILNNVKNAMNGLQFGFGYPAEGIGMVLAAHGPSAAYGYADAVWQKYRIGDFFGLTDVAGKPVKSNVYLAAKNADDPSADPNDATSMYQDTSIEMLQKRGLQVLTCHTAVEEQSRAIVKRGFAPAGMSPTDVANDILTHLIPGAFVVPAMVAAVAVLQREYHYTYIALTF